MGKMDGEIKECLRILEQAERQPLIVPYDPNRQRPIMTQSQALPRDSDDPPTPIIRSNALGYDPKTDTASMFFQKPLTNTQWTPLKTGVESQAKGKEIMSASSPLRAGMRSMNIKAFFGESQRGPATTAPSTIEKMQSPSLTQNEAEIKRRLALLMQEAGQNQDLLNKLLSGQQLNQTDLDGTANLPPLEDTLMGNGSGYNDSKYVDRSNGGSVRTTRKNILKGTNSKGVRKNFSVYFGHENWNLVMNMMIGIRTALKNLAPEQRDLTEHDFRLKAQYELVNKRVDSFDYTKACKFYDYAPLVFEKIRNMYGISNTDFLRSIGPEQLLGNLIIGNLLSLTELSSSGQSGSFFYYSPDGKFLLKTISKGEFFYLRDILPGYYTHLLNNYNTMLTKIFSLHKMKVYKSKTSFDRLYMLVMGNLFSHGLEINVRYDLKGSSYGRRTREPGKTFDSSVALKDLDFVEDGIRIKLPEPARSVFLNQMMLDSEFLRFNRINDYSLLIGFHQLPPRTG
jgi:hypothetical protein